jgi:acyl carrier protein
LGASIGGHTMKLINSFHTLRPGVTCALLMVVAIGCHGGEKPYHPGDTGADTGSNPHNPPGTVDPVLEKVRGIIAEQLDIEVEAVTPEKSLTDDLGADSLAIVELVLALEEEFGTKIPDDKVDSIKTVDDAVDYVKQNRPVR